MFGVNSEDVAKIKEKYLGKKVRIKINDPFNYTEGVGIVERVDDIGQLHGTWGGLSVIIGEDYVEILE